MELDQRPTLRRIGFPAAITAYLESPPGLAWPDQGISLSSHLSCTPKINLGIPMAAIEIGRTSNKENQ